VSRPSRPNGRPLRIAVDVREWRAGTSTGIARVLTGFVQWAATATAHELVLLGNQHTDFRVAGDRIERLVEREGNRLIWDQRTLPALLGGQSADVLWSPYYKGPLRAPCPVVVTANDLIDLHFPRGSVIKRGLLPWWMRTMLRAASHVLTLSEYSRSDIVTRLGIEASHISVFPLAVDDRFLQSVPQSRVEAVRDRHELPESYALYVGRCTPHKNLSTLTRAWARLPASVRSRHGLVLAGGDVGRFAEVARAAGIDAHLPGFIDDADLPALYAGATMMCFPSLYEGFGLPPLEAMACGTAVAAADATSIPEVVGDAALLVAPRDEEDWETAIAALLEDPAARERLVQAGHARSGAFTRERSGRAVLDCLGAAADGRTP